MRRQRLIEAHQLARSHTVQEGERGFEPRFVTPEPKNCTARAASPVDAATPVTAATAASAEAERATCSSAPAASLVLLTQLILIFQRRGRRHREVKRFVQGHTDSACERNTEGLHPRPSRSSCCAWTYTASKSVVISQQVLLKE